jgi:hypothetical protein
MRRRKQAGRLANALRDLVIGARGVTARPEASDAPTVPVERHASGIELPGCEPLAHFAECMETRVYAPIVTDSRG